MGYGIVSFIKPHLVLMYYPLYGLHKIVNDFFKIAKPRIGTLNSLIFLNINPTRLMYALPLYKSSSTPLGKKGSILGSISLPL
jgi:hypothetical protein